MPRPATKKIAIEEAAIKLFATRGLPGTVIKEIAREADVTEGALYKHYRSKNEMAWQLFCRELTDFSLGLEKKLFNPDLSGREQIGEGVTYIYEFYKEKPMNFAFILLSQHGFPEEELLDQRLNPNDMIIKYVQGLMDRGDIKESDPVIMAGMLMGIVIQPVVFHYYQRLDYDPLDKVNDIISACHRVLEV